MNPIEVIKKAQTLKLIDEDEEDISIDLLPGLTDEEIKELESNLPCKIPNHIIVLLKFCRGFDGCIDVVDFTGQDMSFEFPEIFPNCMPIAHDGFGNYWIIDFNKNSIDWAPIYFCCHDAPVILYQSSSLSHFLDELFKMFIPPHKSEIDDVHEDRIANVWSKNPNVLSYEECISSSDAVLSDFAKELDDTFQFIDLRNAKIGDGFSWGRYGPNTVNRRYKDLPVFAYQKRKSFLKRIFSK